MKEEELLYEELSDKVLKPQLMCAEKSTRTVENCELESSYTLVEEMEEGAPIAEDLNLLPGFVETVVTVVTRCVPVAKDVVEEFAG